jgi:hypothetical protein
VSDGFAIEIDGGHELEAFGAGAWKMERFSDFFQRILDRASQMLMENLPAWSVVEAGVRLAYDTYMRPLEIPNFIDNILVEALVREVHKIYDSLA